MWEMAPRTIILMRPMPNPSLNNWATFRAAPGQETAIHPCHDSSTSCTQSRRRIYFLPDNHSRPGSTTPLSVLTTPLLSVFILKLDPLPEPAGLIWIFRSTVYYLPLTMYKGFENDSGELEKAETAEPITLSIKAPPSQHAFPNGGLAAWLNVIGSMLICFCSLGFLQSFGVFQDFYTRHSLSEFSPSQISWIGSTQLFLSFFITPISGKLLDDGYFSEMLLGSSILHVVCIFSLSFAQPHQYYQAFLSQGVGQGVAMGLMFLPSVSILAQYFSVRRSLMLGLGISGSSLAGILLPIILNQFFNGRVGFAWGVRYLGFIALGMLIIANLMMKPRIKTKRRPSKEENMMLLRKLATDVPYIIAIIGLVLVFWGLYVPFFYLQLFAVLHGIDGTVAFHSITILNASSLAGRIIPNLVAEYIGVMNATVPSAFLSGALLFAMLGAKTVPGLIVFAILYGFFSGSSLALSLAAVTAFADSVSEVGIRTGVCMCAISMALLTGNPIVGLLLHVPEYKWERPVIFCGAVMLAGSSLLLIARTLLAKKRGTWKV